ncbi:hypothetical protein IFM51744_10009 [Aspergillus udagawae]|nr:hypothetical protein IFM51744_10009 [Aspergillus udagawae]
MRGLLAGCLGMIRNAFQDRSYGMRQIALSGNIAYELVYVLSPRYPAVAGCLPPLAGSGCGGRLHHHAPRVQRYLPWIFVLSNAGLMTAHLALIAHLGPLNAAALGTLFCPLLLIAVTVCQMKAEAVAVGSPVLFGNKSFALAF